MERIHFKTSHNLVLTFPMASLFSRVGAFLIDSIIVSLIVMVIYFLLPRQETLALFISLPIFSFFNLLFAIKWMGQSPGKKLLKIRVVGLDGNTPSLKSHLVRWVFRLVDIYLSMGSIGIISILSSENGQRLGDLLAGTTVISHGGNSIHSFNSISQLNQVVIAEPKYNNLTQYNDEDMLVVKQTLARYKQHPTPENEHLMNLLSQKFCSDLGLEEDLDDQSNALFLQEVLEEYILVTR